MFRNTEYGVDFILPLSKGTKLKPYISASVQYWLEYYKWEEYRYGFIDETIQKTGITENKYIAHSIWYGANAGLQIDVISKLKVVLGYQLQLGNTIWKSEGIDSMTNDRLYHDQFFLQFRQKWCECIISLSFKRFRSLVIN